MSCIYSTLVFLSEQARGSHVTPVITLDQPLWWKAHTIIRNKPNQSVLKHHANIRLGGLHVIMSFLGCIGHLMCNSGISELPEVIYDSNTVIHMLSGKALSRAISGHFS